MDNDNNSYMSRTWLELVDTQRGAVEGVTLVRQQVPHDCRPIDDVVA